jgi:hypothetical protein
MNASVNLEDCFAEIVVAVRVEMVALPTGIEPVFEP